MKKLNLHLYWESETLLSPISAQIEMVVYEHKVFMTLVNILLSALRHWLSTTQGRHNKNFFGKLSLVMLCCFGQLTVQTKAHLEFSHSSSRHGSGKITVFSHIVSAETILF